MDDVHGKRRFKVKKPHDIYFQQLLQKDDLEIRNDRSGTGLYFKRMQKDLKDLFGCRPNGHNRWILYKKRPFRSCGDRGKYQLFEI